MVASVGSRLIQKDAGLALTVSDIGLAGAIYIVGRASARCSSVRCAIGSDARSCS